MVILGLQAPVIIGSELPQTSKYLRVLQGYYVWVRKDI